MNSTPTVWIARDRRIPLDPPVIVGIINVTPDSFSDGGRFASPEAAVEHGVRLVDEGADVLDVGGESTRPQGAVSISAAEEIERIVPVISGLRGRLPHVSLSVDTTKSGVAAAAIEAGADIVNDVSAFRLDPKMAELCARTGAGVVLMHSRGGVEDMATYEHASYGDDPAAEILAELRASLDAALEAGVRAERVAVDPGVGFAKQGPHSLAVLGAIHELAEWGHPVMVGVSRKRFIGELTGVSGPLDRLEGTIAANIMALVGGARIFRVHDARAARRALTVAWAIARSGSQA